MLKKILFLVVPVALMATSVFGEDDLLKDVANLKVSAISDAQIVIDGAANALDVDALANSAGTEKSTDAIEACFRRCGYGGYGGYGYGCGYGYGYGYGCYSSCYSPCYSYCYPTYYCYRPVYYSACYPSYGYNWCWGCY